MLTTDTNIISCTIIFPFSAHYANVSIPIYVFMTFFNVFLKMKIRSELEIQTAKSGFILDKW